MGFNRTLVMLTVGLGALSGFASAAQAQYGGSSRTGEYDKGGTFFGQEARGKWLIGIKGAKVQNAAADFDDSDNVGVLLGYEFRRPVGFDGKAALEVEWLGSTSDGDIGIDSDFGTVGTWDATIVNVFFAYRTPGVVYFKAKVGGVYSDVTAKVGGAEVSNDEVGLGFGAGLGVKIGDVGRLELEYTGSTGDNDIEQLSLGGLLAF